MKNVLILGGGGFIGSNIARYLVARGDCRVTVADILHPRGWNDIVENPADTSRLRVVTDDFTSKTSFDRLGGGFDEVYMMAAIVGVNRCLAHPDEVMRNNTMLTMQTLEWLHANPVRRLLFASSSENYAGTSDAFGVAIPTPETVPLCIVDVKHPRFSYAMTKMHGECAFFHSATPYGYECTVLRYQNIIGPDMGFGHVIPHLVERFLKKESGPFKVYGHDQTRAFCSVDDAVRGTVAAMETERASGEIYHIGSEDEISMETLTREVGTLLGYGGDYVAAMTYPGSVARRCPDIRKCREHLGYAPGVPWREAVRRTVDWYRTYFSAGHLPRSGGFAPPENFLGAARQ